MDIPLSSLPIRLRYILRLAGALVTTLATPALYGEVAELEPVADVGFLYSEMPPFRQNLINGGKAPIGAGLHSGGSNRGSVSLVRFDPSTLPAKAKVNKVELLLFPVYAYPASIYRDGERLAIYQLTEEDANWEEGTGESLKEPDSTPLTAPGANGAYLNMTTCADESNHDGTRWLSGKIFGTMDLDGDALAHFPLHEHGLALGTPIAIELPPELIERWRTHPEQAKAGLVLMMESNNPVVEESRFAIFESREGEQTPRLMITYEP